MQWVSTRRQLTLAVCTSLRAVAADTLGEQHVLGKDGDALGVDGAEVGVLEHHDEERLGRLVHCHDGFDCEAHVALELLGNLPHKALEGPLFDQKLRRLLVAADLTQRNGAGPVAVGLLQTTGGGGGLASGLRGQGLAGRLAAGGLACGLLGAGHDVFSKLHRVP